jgi:FkbM family methyltransferase
MNRHELRAEHVNAVREWQTVRGDYTLALNYPLEEQSIVVDVGGSTGPWSNFIFEKYHCNIHVFEPLISSFHECEKRFEYNNKVTCYNLAVSNENKMVRMEEGIKPDDSSFYAKGKGTFVDVKVVDISEELTKLNITDIDLMKINIEGEEYNVIDSLYASNRLTSIEYLLIQPHHFVDFPEEKLTEMKSKLSETHECEWDYRWTWESWKRK